MLIDAHAHSSSPAHAEAIAALPALPAPLPALPATMAVAPVRQVVLGSDRPYGTLPARPADPAPGPQHLSSEAREQVEPVNVTTLVPRFRRDPDRHG